ncbi:anti-sigma factor antagonist [Alkalibaculum sp. M08DMB]|uniref:Anti-sigma factor antagonist n=1 Tax=Alkalibaculum sporogenes TaxID=2655001 RepID=A0A6A7KA27_9FIRM|nr:anti-sigma factor antagonist [Alkalibaculum sporogenes]MPW26330.1 anti-sigma factor antagonist [Alkalibaculum sporogenes]
MELQTRIIEDTLLVKIVGELDHHSSEDIRNQIDKLLSSNSIINIIFDLSHMNFMDSSGVGMFMGRYKKIKMKNGIPVMINIQDSNRRLLKMSGLFNIYQEYKDLDDAILAIRRGSDE